MRFGQQVGRAHEEEEACVDGEQLAERVLRDGDEDADRRPHERRQRVHRQPAQGPSQVAPLAEHEVDRIEPIGEVVGDDREEDEEAGCRVELEGQPDSEAVDEAVQREPGCAEGADLRVRLRLLRLVAMMQDD